MPHPAPVPGLLTPWAEVVGDPIAHSRSPTIHSHWLERLGLSGRYGATRVGLPDLAGWLAERRSAAGFAGANLTMPLKEAVLPFLDALDPRAAALGAVNTVVCSGDGRLTGYNSDVDGVAEPLQAIHAARLATPADIPVQIIGAGGAARAAILGVRQAGHHDIHLYNRTMARAAAVAARAGQPEPRAHGLGELRPLDRGRPHLILNASAMGMKGEPAVPVDLALYPPGTIVFDMVYAPLETPLLSAARRHGLCVIDGLSMLVGQAATAFALLFGVSPPRDDASETALRQKLLS